MSIVIPVERMRPSGPGRKDDESRYVQIAVRKNNEIVDRQRTRGAATYLNSTLVIEVKRCLDSGIHVPVALVSVQSFILTGLAPDPFVNFIPDEGIDPRNGVIAAPGTVRGLINTASQIFSDDGITLDR